MFTDILLMLVDFFRVYKLLKFIYENYKISAKTPPFTQYYQSTWSRIVKVT